MNGLLVRSGFEHLRSSSAFGEMPNKAVNQCRRLAEF